MNFEELKKYGDSLPLLRVNSPNWIASTRTRNSINSFLLEKIKVDFTFVNLVNKSNFISRLSKRKKLNRYDKFSINFYNKVQKGFLKIALTNRSKYLILDSNKDSLKNIENKIIKKINKILK